MTMLIKIVPMWVYHTGIHPMPRGSAMLIWSIDICKKKKKKNGIFFIGQILIYKLSCLNFKTYVLNVT